MSTSSSSASDDSSDPDNLSDWTDIVQNVAQYTPHLNVKITEWEDTVLLISMNETVWVKKLRRVERSGVGSVL